MKDMILLLKWGGLGDSLTFSTLPELCYKNNINFYLSSQSKNIFRNEEIFDLVWKCNPYFKGFSDKEPNAGNIHISDLGRRNDNDSMIQCFERIYFKESVNKYPKVYYDCNYIDKLKDITLIEVSAISAVAEYNQDKENVFNIINKLMKEENEKNLRIVIHNNINQNNLFSFDLPIININNLYEYCDFIYSSKRLICLDSGSNSLSSAIVSKQTNRKTKVDVIMVRDSGYIYNNLNYHNERY